MKDVIIIGGGLAGLTNAILLNRAGLSVQLFEEKKYPFHRVCGEYISNEVIPFLSNHDLFPEELDPSRLSEFHLTSVSGKGLKMPLDLGGFGVSRYAFDQWLLEKATAEGVLFINERIIDVNYNDDGFEVKDKDDLVHEAKVVIGAFGKRSLMDKQLQRDFLKRRSPYVGVKYHLKTNEVANDVIALHNFKNGYCGISRIENDTFNLCYLSHRSNLKSAGSVEEMEEQVLKKNPYLNRILSNSEMLFEKPAVINEITFEKKEPVYNHVLMSGDSAGMITPLCGNGMAMAIHSAKLLSETLIESFKNGFDRDRVEREYRHKWNNLFARRLWAGRKIQRLFGSPAISEFAVSFGKWVPPFASYLMKQTHGEPFS
ncbi:NAD(P)/FAD-dependent oxidoreductase [Ekhidna sp.]|uniref:NAD(P)/FAD-dependent oxidoreductase n=1 Tax=Ekhidna sp. TaxID=2608089 RepID=UPI003B5B005D